MYDTSRHSAMQRYGVLTWLGRGGGGTDRAPIPAARGTVIVSSPIRAVTVT
jgi:hypothetical protein